MSGGEEEVRDHVWWIEERELLRHETRRGRRHAYEWLDPASTALVVVDMVPFFVAESAYCRGIVPRINTLAAAVRASGGVVAWVVPATGLPTPAAIAFLGAEVARTYAASGGEGALPTRLWPDLDTAAGDVFAEKSSHGALYPGRSTLPLRLEGRGIDTLVVTGTVTNVCVESTVREAHTEGYRTILVADACAAMRDTEHQATVHVVHRSFGDVRTTAEVVALLHAGPPAG